jgi:hypothetical protein
LAFSANHAAIDYGLERLRVATFAKQHDFSQIEIRELSCRTSRSARSARDTEGCAGFLVQQFFVQFGVANI